MCRLILQSGRKSYFLLIKYILRTFIIKFPACGADVQAVQCHVFESGRYAKSSWRNGSAPDFYEVNLGVAGSSPAGGILSNLFASHTYFS